MEVNMDSSTLLYLAAFFFILGAALVAAFWGLLAIIGRISHKGKTAVSADPNLTEVARLMRDNKNKDLVVEMDGNTFRASSELSPAQQRRLTFSSNVLAKWLEQPTPDDLPAPVEQPDSPSQLAETPAQESDWVPVETVPMQPHATIVPPFMTEPLTEVKPVSTQLTDVVGGILKPATTPANAFKSIAMQINDILQTRITGTPFEARGITVNDGPDHGVVVIVDGEKYQGVKDVPDESVRNLIRSAVMEWEKLGKVGSK
jgi:hypothetical protein